MKWLLYAVTTLVLVLGNGAWFFGLYRGPRELLGMLLFNAACLLFLRLFSVSYSSLAREEKEKRISVTVSFLVLFVAIPFIWWGAEVLLTESYFIEFSRRKNRPYAALVNLIGNRTSYVGASLVHFAFGGLALYVAFRLYRHGRA